MLLCFQLTAQNDTLQLPEVIISSIRGHFESQEKVVDSLNDLSWKWMYEAPLKVLDLLSFSINTAEEINYYEGLLDGLHSKSIVLSRIHQVEEAKEVCLIAIQNAKKLKAEKKLASLYTTYAGTIENTEIDSAFSYLKQALEISKRLKDTIAITSNLNGIANLYHNLKKDSVAILYYQEIIDLAKKINFQPAIAGSYNNMANAFSNLKNYNKSLTYFHKALDLKKLVKDNFGTANSLSNIGLIYVKVKNFTEANSYFNKALKLYTKLDIPAKEASTLINLGHSYISRKHFSKGLYYTERGKSTLVKHNISDPYLESIIQGQYYEAYKGLRKFENALKAHEELTKLEEKKRDAVYAKELSSNQAEFETRIYQKKNEILEADQTVNRQTIRLKNAALQLLILSVVLALVVLGLLIVRFRRKQKTADELKDKNDQLEQVIQEKKDLLNEVHHRVKNNMQMISAFLEMQLFKSTTPASKAALQNSISRLQAMAVIHRITEDVDANKLISSVEFIEALIRQLSSGLNTSQVQIATNVDEVFLTSEQVTSLGLIINELVTNAFKYAFTHKEEGMITVDFKSEKDMISLVVSDDGAGVDETTADGTGLKLVKAFVRKMKGQLYLNTQKGTTFTISIPNA